MELSTLPKLKGYKRPGKRVGRGYGSGKGAHTVGRGQKGQKSRNRVNLGFEGGQLPLYRRLPHMGGFTPYRKPEVGIINIEKLKEIKAEIITPETLVAEGFIKKVPRGGIKVLGSGEIDTKIHLKGFIFSEAAKKKIEAAGGIID